MPIGASSKREREYNALKKTFKRERRYPGREEEVAARIVNQVAGKLDSLSGHAIKTLERYERQHKNPKTLLVKFRQEKEATVEG
jgi:hypothetical protein